MAQSSSSIVISLALFLCKNKYQQIKDTWRIIGSKNVNEQKKLSHILNFSQEFIIESMDMENAAGLEVKQPLARAKMTNQLRSLIMRAKKNT